MCSIPLFILLAYYYLCDPQKTKCNSKLLAFKEFDEGILQFMIDTSFSKNTQLKNYIHGI